MKTMITPDLFKILNPYDVVCITTNGCVKSNGQAVMGKGIALQAATLMPSLPGDLGRDKRLKGNACHEMGIYRFMRDGISIPIQIVTFPTKEDWKDPSNLEIIERSCKELIDVLEDIIEDINHIYLPAPGCGAGGLDWKQVSPILEEYFENEKHITIVADHDIFKRKGKLTVCGIAKLHELNMHEFPNKRLFAVRKVTESAIHAVKKYNLQEVPQLSPSAGLFGRHFKWKKGEFTHEEIELLDKKNISTTRTDAWWYLYAPEFIEEMKTRSDLGKCMVRIMDLLDQGENVLVVCYCPEVLRCHRGLIGLVIQQKGYTVEFK